MQDSDTSTATGGERHHPAFLVGVAQRGIDNVITFATNLDEARAMLTDLRAQLETATVDSSAGIDRGRHVENLVVEHALRAGLSGTGPQRRDALRAFAAAVEGGASDA
jgi:hypothetical protein